MTDGVRSGPKVALIFPPAMHPTGPPLGVANLAAYLRRNGVAGDVKALDLNLAYYDLALKWLGNGRLRMSMRKWSHAETRERVIESFHFVRGRREYPLSNIGAYNEHASIYSDFGALLNGLFENFARRMLCGLPVPVLAEEFFRELLRPVREYHPDITGFSILFSQQLHFSLALAGELKKEGGGSIVLGGATLSVMPNPEKLLEGPVPIRVEGGYREARLAPLVDFLLVGEGEPGLAALMDYGRGAGWKDAPGLVRVEGGTVVSNPPGMVEDLDQPPLPDFNAEDLPRYHSPEVVLPYLGARGCFWRRCAFCTHRKTYLAYREESVERTVARLAELKERYGARHFSFVDEMVHAGRFSRLSREILKRGLEIEYAAYAKPVASFDRGLLDEMHRSGARMLMWGVESGSQRVLDAMRKGTRAADMERVLMDAHAAGIWSLAFIMFGFPTETMEEWGDTLALLERCSGAVDALSKSRFLLLAGSEVHRRPEDFGISRITARAESDPVSVAFDYEADRGMDSGEVEKLYRAQLPALGRFGRSPWFAVFRDHMLLHAAAGAGSRAASGNGAGQSGDGAQ